MRQIKFRAWLPSEKLVTSPFNMWSIVEGYRAMNKEEFEEAILMQFTGLKDKNGKEIYEGDIVAGDSGFVSPVKGIVKYQGLAFNFQGEKLKKDFDGSTDWFYTITSDLTEDRHIEVIGNIYENKELLK